MDDHRKDHIDPEKKTRPTDNLQKKKKNLFYWELCSPVNQWAKIKEKEKRDKYLDVARELRKLWNLRLIVVLIMIGSWNGL